MFPIYDTQIIIYEIAIALQNKYIKIVRIFYYRNAVAIVTQLINYSA